MNYTLIRPLFGFRVAPVVERVFLLAVLVAMAIAMPATPEALVGLGVIGTAVVGAIVDGQLLFSDAQALTATAASTNIVDTGADRNIGIGEPMCVVIAVDTALAGTTPTFQAAVQTDDNASFSSPATVAQMPAALSAAAAGLQIVIPIPPNTDIERYIRVNYTLGGTTPTITVSADLRSLKGVQAHHAYPDGFTISS